VNLAPLLRDLRTDFGPDPERLRGSLEIAGQVMVLTLIAMAIQLPEAALAAYLLFFAHRDNKGESLKTALLLTAAASLGVVLAIPLLGAVVDAPMLRLGAIIAFTLLGMFMAHATSLGPLAGTAGFVFAFALTLYDVVPYPELLSRALEWLWVVVALPMLVIAVWAALAGPRPDRRARERIQALQAAMTAPQSDKARELLDEGLAPLDGYLAHARRLGALSRHEAEAMARDGDDAYYRLALAEAGATPRASAGAPAPLKQPFLAADAFTNPEHIQFAIKVLVAVLITYGFYTAFGMFEIHTAMITCFYVTLETRGETHHKIALRLIGVILGLIAGTLAISLFMPHMTDIGQLLILVGAVSFVAGWIALGGERIAYAGWQLALCFFLVVLNDFGPSLDISAATDRLLGILVGSIVVWAVFTVLWPVSASDKAAHALERFDAAIAEAPRPRTGREVETLRLPIAEAAHLARAREYELGAEAAPDPEAALARLHRLLKGAPDAALA